MTTAERKSAKDEARRFFARVTAAKASLTLLIEIPMAVPSLANMRGHWKIARVKKNQRSVVSMVLSAHKAPPLPVVVSLTRVAPRQLDDDNLAGAFKAIRDSVAAWLGTDDRPGSGITWLYFQERATFRKYQAARVEVRSGK